MNVIRNKAILAVLPLLVSLALPVMAQTATTTVERRLPSTAWVSMKKARRALAN